jgi:hypothetical protein
MEIQLARLAEDQVQAEVVVTSTVPVLAAAPTVCPLGVMLKVHAGVTPSCVTVNA